MNYSSSEHEPDFNFCGCPACAGAFSSNGLTATGVSSSEEPIPGAEALLYSSNSTINALLALSTNPSARWNYPSTTYIGDTMGGLGTGVNVTYSFFTAVPSYYASATGTIPTSATFQAFSEAQKAATRSALAEVSAITKLTFTEVSDAGDGGQLRLGSFPMYSGNGFVGYAYYPATNWKNVAGDIWLDTYATNQDMTTGYFGYATLLHEIGHAIGLKHPHQGDVTLPTAVDNRQWTVMSYTNQPKNTIATFNGTSLSYKNIFGDGYGVYDILALQYLYGTNTSYKAGADTYSWAANAQFFDTIWDAGGTDTIDLSNQTLTSRLDLTPGTQSSVNRRTTDAEKKIGWANTSYSVTSNYFTGENNLGIAFGVTIENVKLGSGSDQVLGNSADNQITGNGGDDTLDGGTGTDTAVYSGVWANYKISASGTTVTVTDTVGTDGTDTLTNVEFLKFADKTVSTVASGLPSVSVAPVSVTEGNSGTVNATFTVTLSEASASPVTMAYTTVGGTALYGVDFTGKSGTLTFTPGQTSQTIAVSVIGDTEVESNETFSLSLSSVSGAKFASGATSVTAVATILDDDVAAANPFTEFGGTQAASDLTKAMQASASGVTISSVTYTGARSAASFYNGTIAGLGIGNGILLTSGDGTPPITNTKDFYAQDNHAAGDARLTKTAQTAFSGAGDTYDAALLSFKLDLQNSGDDAATFQIIFGSDEYPEFGDSKFVDVAAVYVNGTNVAFFNDSVTKTSSPTQPLSVTNQNVYAGVFRDNTKGGIGLEYDGISQLLTITASNLKQTGNEITIGIADTGDALYDSGIFIANLKSAKTLGGAGVYVNVAGTSGNNVLSGTALDEYFDAGDGDDKITPGGGVNIVAAGAGSDSIISGEGKNTIDGGAGTDTVTYDMSSAGATVTVSNGLVSVKNKVSAFPEEGGAAVVAGFQDTLTNVEFLKFADKTIAVSDLTGVTVDTTANDVVLLQANSPSVTSAAAGNDTYILSGVAASKAGSFTLTDTQGSNSLQLVAGLNIKSFVVAANALQLSLASGAEITVLDANLLTYEIGGNRIAGIDNADVSFAAFASTALGVTVPTSGTVTGGAKILGIPVGTGTFSVASASDNIVLPQANSPAVLSSAAGNDTYILSPHLLSGAGTYTISDSQGTNSLQIVGGTTVSSFVVAATALQLTFSTGAVVTVLEADKFGYEVGGNIAAGINGADTSFATFVSTHLGVAVPTSGTVTGGTKSFAAPAPMIETLGLTLAEGYLL